MTAIAQQVTSHYAPHLQHKLEVLRQGLQRSQHDFVLIGSGVNQYYFRDDLNYPFKPNAYFMECVPVAQPDCYLLITEHNAQLLQKQENDFWHSPPSDLPDHVKTNISAQAYTDFDEVMQALPGGQGAYLGEQLVEGLALTFNPEPLLDYIDYRRAVKTEFELASMREANRLAARAHLAAERAYESGESELGIHHAYLQAIQVQDQDLPYPNIIALNEHCAVLHHHHLGRDAPEAHRALLIDAGASHSGYAADVTRTYTAPGSSFYDLLLGMERVQTELVSEVKAGVGFGDLHVLAHRKIAELLCAAGVITVGVEQALTLGLSKVFFPHGLGHLLGIQVHDKGGQMASADGELQAPPEQFPTLRSTRTIEDNMVLTIEPGLYFIPMLLEEWAGKKELNWALVNDLLPYGGIRIEDNVFVQNGKLENMTRDAFAALANAG